MDKSEVEMDAGGESRRAFVKKAAYVAPAVLTLPAAPAYAKHGSENPSEWDGDDHDRGNGNDRNNSKGKGRLDSKGRDHGDGHPTASTVASAARTPTPLG